MFYAAMFLILHEAGHIADRHLDYWFKLQGSESEELARHRTAMEYLADKWAVSSGTLLLKDYDDEQFRLYGFAIGISLLIADQLRPPKSGHSVIHPLASNRLLLIQAVAQTHVSLVPEAKLQKLCDGIDEAQASWRRMGWEFETIDIPSPDDLIGHIEVLDKLLDPERSGEPFEDL
jgi:hypothetical protein